MELPGFCSEGSAASTSALPTLVPNPYAANGSGSFIAAVTDFRATFTGVAQDGGPGNFTVRGLQSGPKFRGQSYTGNGSTTIVTPTTVLFAGEEVELVITSALSCADPWVGRVRVASTTPATGTFPVFNTFDVGNNPFSVAAADLDHDGDIDLAVANNGESDLASTVSVLLGNRTGAFEAQQTYEVGVSPSSVSIGDLNADGHLDLAVANTGTNNEMGHLSVLLGRGDGTFQPQQIFPVADLPRSVAIGDLNGDGFTDMAVASLTEPGVITVLLGDGTGDFRYAGFFSTGGSAAFAVEIADLNADGVLDLAAANYVSNNVGVLLGRGDGTFQLARTFAVGNLPVDLEIGDLDRDGDLDIAAANLDSNTISLLFGNGTGEFPTTQTQTVGEIVRSLAIGDLNGDGRLDLAAVTQNPAAVSVLLNSASGFLPEQSFDTGPRVPFWLTIGDLNRDGRLDLIVAREGAADLDNLSVLLGR